MKNVSYLINGVLAVAIIVLFVLFFTSKSSCDNSKPTGLVNGDSAAKITVAYVDTDSLLTKYEFAKTESERLMNKFKSSEGSIGQKQRQIQSQYAEFQDKLQKNVFLTEEKAKQEHQRLQKLEMELQQMAQRIQGELAQEEMKINVQIADSVRVALKEYNKAANYEIIFSNKGMDNILIAKDSYNITDEVVALLNSRYKKATPAAK